MTRTITTALLVAAVLAAIGVGSTALSERRKTQIADPSDPYSPIVCIPDIETKGKIRTILLEATEQALKDHVVRMHEIWMRDERGQPERASNGTRQGVKAFIAGREFLQKWDPPICPP